MSNKWWVLAAVGCGTFMSTLDSSIVNIALPTLTKDFGVSLYQVKWVVVIYLLMITCLLLPFGRLSDLYGRKPVFQLGFFIFTFGSALCGISPSLYSLVAARAIQSLGAAMLMANSPAIVTAAFPFRERGAALGTLAMIVSCGLISGPSVGGFLISHLGWRSIFWVNIPIGIAGIGLTHRYLFQAPLVKDGIRFDWLGAFLQTVFLVCFIVVFDPPQVTISGGLPLPAPRWIMLILAILFGAAFVRVESESKAPLLDLTLLKIRMFWAANLSSFLMFVAYSSVFVLMPFFLEEVMKLKPAEAGLYMTAIPLTIFVVAPISGRMSDRIGSRWLSFVGAFALALTLGLLGGVLGDGITEGMDKVYLVIALVFSGVALGLFQSPNNNSIMGAVPSGKLGVASAMMATVRNLGLVTGTGLSTSLFTWQIHSSGNFIYSIHFVFAVTMIVAIASAFCSFLKKVAPLPIKEVSE